MESEWESYQGEYEKTFYDIKLDDRTIINECYPNAGIFHSNNGDTIDEYRITHFRLSKWI